MILFLRLKFLNEIYQDGERTCRQNEIHDFDFEKGRHLLSSFPNDWELLEIGNPRLLTDDQIRFLLPYKKLKGGWRRSDDQ